MSGATWKNLLVIGKQTVFVGEPVVPSVGDDADQFGRKLARPYVHLSNGTLHTYLADLMRSEILFENQRSHNYVIPLWGIQLGIFT